MPYDRWADDGWMQRTPGRATDRVAIARRLADVRQSYNVLGIAFDRWRFEDLGKLLSDEGIDLPMVEFIPGFKSYAPAVDAFERAVLDKRMQHNGNPLMRWQAGNVIIETDPAGNRKPTKSKSLDRIDGVISAIMACGLAERDEGPKVYKGSGPMWV